MTQGTGSTSKESLPERTHYEYQRFAQLTLYFLDYRLKMFGIFVALNGVGLTAVLAQKSSSAAIALSAFILLSSVISYLIAQRANDLAYKYRKTGRDLEDRLGLKALAALHMETHSDRPNMNLLFRAFYGLVILAWVILVITQFWWPELFLASQSS